MKKIYRLFVATGLLFTIGVSAAASSFHDYAASKPMAAIHQVKEARPVQADIDPATTTSLKQETPPSAGGQLSRAPRRAVSAADLPTNPLQIDYASGDSYITASAVTFTLEGNTISISNFAGYGKTITGTVNLETGVVAFSRQQVQDNATYGNCDLVSVNDGLASIDTLASVTGTLADGILTLEHWTMLITQGDYAGYILGTVRDKSVFKAANATMNVVQLNYDDEGNLTGSTPDTYPVITTQTATNEVEVLNFLGMGYRHLIGIKSDKTLAIAPQQLFRNNDYGVFFFYPFDEATGITTIGGTLRGTTEGNKLAWGGSAIHTSNGKYFYARYRSCEIQLPFDLQYPAAQTQAGFKGSGTEDDPWLIETMADLLALSDSVNYGTTTDPTGKYVKMFEGKFFKQTKAINAKGYNFPPIGGNDDLYRFAGTYDGDNKAISNLTINTGTNGYAGLFGSVDTCGVLKNISITSPVIECSYYFAGAVAGNCNGTMINCKATTPKVTGQYTVGGLAGKVGPATQCSVTTGTIVAEAQCGGVFGVSRYPLSFINATNTNVMITGTTSQSPVGGLLGQMSGDFGGSISDSYFSGNVYLTRTTQFAGGIVGTTSRNTIDRCFSLAQIGMLGNSVGTAVAGGIVGGAIATDFTDCYFAGENRLSTSRSGAIVGYTLNVIYTGFPDHINLTRCYVTGMVNCTLKADYNPYVGQFDTQGAGLPPVLTDCYYDEQMLPLITSKNGALKTSEMTGTAPKLEGFSADTWTFTANLYPRLTSVATNQAAYVSAAAILLADTTQTAEAVTTNFNVAVANSVKWYASIDGKNGTAGHTLDITQNTGEVVLNGGVGIDTLIAQNGNITKYVFIKVSPASQFEGAGTEDSPFLIRNKEDLIRLSTITFDNKMSYNGVYFKLTNDIDLENDPVFKGIAANGTNSTYAFGGILDGDNHTIHNLRMVTCPLNDEKKTTNTTSNCGFINNLKVGGVVKNLRIADDCYFEMYSRSAAIVGYNYGGTIENCRNYATVIAHSGNVGAMTGYNGDGGIIRGCYNAGKITAGYQYVGGICANNRGIIENCQNDGEVSVEHINEQYVATRGNTAGGIAVANFGTMSNVLNTGYIHAPKYVGGIMAWFNNKNGQIASNAINVGIIDFDAETGATEAGTIGNIVGKMYQVGTAQNCYYDGQLSIYDAAHSASHDGMTALTTAQLTAGESLAGLTAAHRSPANSELDATYWVFEKGKYPMLKAFADEAGAKAASLSVAYFAQNTRSDSIKRDVELNVADGLSWTLAGGQQAFEIKEGYTLWMDPAAELADTLIATCGKFVKRIPIVATPDTVPLPTMEVTNAAQNIVTFADDLEGVTFYYTTDGSLPTAAGKSTTGDAQLDAGTYVVTVIGTKHNYYPSEPASFNVTMTGVDGVQTASEVISVRYINVAGIESDKPFSGVNIVVTTHADGSQTATKVIF